MISRRTLLGRTIGAMAGAIGLPFLKAAEKPVAELSVINNPAFSLANDLTALESLPVGQNWTASGWHYGDGTPMPSDGKGGIIFDFDEIAKRSRKC